MSSLPLHAAWTLLLTHFLSAPCCTCAQLTAARHSAAHTRAHENTHAHTQTDVRVLVWVGVGDWSYGSRIDSETAESRRLGDLRRGAVRGAEPLKDSSRFNFHPHPKAQSRLHLPACSTSQVTCSLGCSLNKRLHQPTLHSWKFSDTSVSWTSISFGVGAAVGVPAALPHDGELTVAPGEEVVRPSSTFRNFFISFPACRALFSG